MISSLIKRPRILILLFFLLLVLVSINPSFNKEGVSIKSVEALSEAAQSGISVPPNTNPKNREIIQSLNGIEVKDIDSYIQELEKAKINQSVKIITNKNEYILVKKTDNLGISVGKVVSSNLRKGLDLEGGSRAILEPQEKLTDSEFKTLMQIMENRLNAFGLSDVQIREASDLLGNKFVIIEIAGATREDVEDLIAKQGKFEAKIDNKTVFTGSKEDLVNVCKDDGTCSGIRSCIPLENQYQCTFEFSISLSPKAAKSQADATSKLDINASSSLTNRYLSKPLDLYIDDKLISSLQIALTLKGVEATQISISGPGYGATQEDAIKDATREMSKLQTILLTGSLPAKLDLLELRSISPVLGESFLRNAVLVGLISLLAVCLFIFIRYKKFKIIIPMVITLVSEISIILGFAALFKQNIDIATIAGIIATIGTGLNDQIVITDEVLKGQQSSLKQSIKNAFFIILVAYAAIFAAMLPLFWAGAGLFKGFALATIVGVTAGILITRPAFAAMLEEII